MKTFHDHLKEEVKIGALSSGGIDIERDAVRDEINGILAAIAARPCVTPYASLNKVRKALAYFSIFLPKRVYLEGRHGVEVWEINQFGDKMGVTDTGEWIHHVPAKYHLFFHYHRMGSMYYLEAKIVDENELEKRVNAAEQMVAEGTDAACRQDVAKHSAPKEPIHDVTSDEKKKGNKEAVSDSEKGLREAKKIKVKLNPEKEVGYTVHDVGPGGKKTLSQSGKTKVKDIKEAASRNPARAYAIRRSANAKYEPDEIAKKYPRWTGVTSDKHNAELKARRIAADAESRRRYDEKHGKKENVDEEKNDLRGTCWKGYTAKGLKKKGNRMVPNCVPVEEGRMPASVIKHKQKLANMTPEEKSKKFAGKSEEELKSMARRHGYGKDSTEYSKHKKLDEGEDEDYMKKYAGSENPAAGVKSVPRKKRLTARAKIIKALGPGKVKSTAGGISHTKRGKEMGDFDTTNYFDRKGNKVGRNTATIEVEREEYEHQLHEISHKLALRAMKKSEKRADDEWEADYAHDRLSDWKTHDTRAHRLRGHMKRKFGNKKIKTDGEDRLGDGGGEGRTGVLGVNKQGKRAGLPPKEQVNRLKSNIKFSLGKHHKPNLPEETQINELKQETVRRYKKAAESDKRSAESSAETSRMHRKNRALPLAKRNAFHDEEKWLKGIAKKREKGIAMADKRLEENLGKAMKKYKAWTKTAYDDGDPRNVKKRLKNADSSFVKRVADQQGKLGGAAELQRRLAKRMSNEETISEKAPPGAKYERMVKHIKAGYAKDGLTKKEKGIAYATAWKAKKRESED